MSLWRVCMRGIVYIGFRARRHRRSLAPVWNDLWWWWPMISGDRWGLSVSDMSYVENPRKKPQPGKLTRPGLEPGSARWEATMLPLDHGVVIIELHINVAETRVLTERPSAGSLSVLCFHSPTTQLSPRSVGTTVWEAIMSYKRE